MDQYREKKKWIEERKREKRKEGDKKRESEREREWERKRGRERDRERETERDWEREKILNVREFDNKIEKLGQSETKMNSIENGSENWEEKTKLKRSKIKKNE